jgi:hypothetical protein
MSTEYSDESVFSCFRIAKVGEERNAITLKATFRNMPAKDLPVNINLKRGTGYIPTMIFTDNQGVAALGISGVPIKGRVPVKYASLSLGISRDKSREKAPLHGKKFSLFGLAKACVPVRPCFHPASYPLFLSYWL